MTGLTLTPFGQLVALLASGVALAAGCYVAILAAAVIA